MAPDKNGRPDRRATSGGARARPRPPTTPEDALARARVHARRAAVEGIAALRALVDGTALATAGTTGERTQLLAPMVTLLEELEHLLSGDATGRPALFDAVLAALEGEIARWEERSRVDADARPVLRAFLGLREILWELGVRRPGQPESGA